MVRISNLFYYLQNFRKKINKDVHEMSTNFGDQFKSVRKKQPKQFNPFPACSKSLFCVTSGWVSKIA